MQKIITVKCPKCNNNHHFHKFSKDKFRNQNIVALFANTSLHPILSLRTEWKNILPALCGKSSFFTPKVTAALPPSVSKLFGKMDLKRMRHSTFLIITVLYQFFIGKSSTRNISLILNQLYNIKLSHVTCWMV